MKQLLLSAILFFITQFSFGQEWPKEVTPQVLQKIKADVEKQIPAFRQKLVSRQLTPDQIEFSLDTFRIDEIASGRMDIDYSTMGMNITMDERTAGYDKLLNKYYGKLLKILKPEDKQVLIAAQKSWIAYRDAEAKLIWAMKKEEYSGGGSMQSNIATSAYSDLVMKRAIEIFNYYDEVIKEK